MSVRTIWTWAPLSGCPSVPFTSPSMAVTWASEVKARTRSPAVARARLRNFIKPPTLRLACINLQYTILNFLLVEQSDLVFWHTFALAPVQRASHPAQHFPRLHGGSRHEDLLDVAEGIGGMTVNP